MRMTWNWHRSYATLVGFGICILLFRTIVMLTDGSLTVLMPWISALLVLEFLLGVGTVLGAIRWWMGGTGNRAWLANRRCCCDRPRRTCCHLRAWPHRPVDRLRSPAGGSRHRPAGMDLGYLRGCRGRSWRCWGARHLAIPPPTCAADRVGIPSVRVPVTACREILEDGGLIPHVKRVPTG